MHLKCMMAKSEGKMHVETLELLVSMIGLLIGIH